MRLTIKDPNNLLSVVLDREIDATQARLIEKVLRVTDITADPDRIEYDFDLALEQLSELGLDSPFGAGESVEAFRG